MASDPALPISLADIHAAAERIKPYAYCTPVFTCSSLNAEASNSAQSSQNQEAAPGSESVGEESKCGADGGTDAVNLFFKMEVFQRSGSFKVRGALNAVLSLDEQQRAQGVVTHSSGNHGAALALAAKLGGGLQAHIVIPRNTPAVKVKAIKGYGGHIELCAPTMEARESACVSIQAACGAVLVPPYNYAPVMAGQGTLALELMQQVEGLDAIIVPISGGGMISGVAVAAKGLNPNIRIFAAEPMGRNSSCAADVAAAKRAGTLVPSEKPATIADGLQGRLGDLTWPVVSALVDGVLVVTEEEIVEAMRMVYERMKVVVEPSGAVGVAAVLASRHYHACSQSGAPDAAVIAASASKTGPSTSPEGDGDEGWPLNAGAGLLKGCSRIGIILCGGNVDLSSKGFFDMSVWQPAQ